MHMRVDEAWQQRGIAEIDGLRPLRMIDRFAHGNNAVAADKYLAWLKQSSCIHLQQPGGMKNDWSVGAGRLLCIQQARAVTKRIRSRRTQPRE